jgi:hypothetical protein
MTAMIRISLGLAALLVGGLMSSTAWAAEPEAPFWRVAGSRLEAGHSITASIKVATGEEITLPGKIEGTEVEIKCKKGSMESGAIEGSSVKHAGKASGTLELKECKLFAEKKEQTECEIPTIKSGSLVSKLELEGKKEAKGTTAVLVFEPKTKTEEKPVIANVTINTCKYKGTYKLEGSFAASLLPENEEFTYIKMVFPKTPITTAWLPMSEEGETSIGLKFAGNTASLQGEMETELTTKEKFGGGIAPLQGIEAPFWTVGAKRLAAEEEREVKSTSESTSATFHSTIKGTETETKCTKTIVIETKLIGSLNQHDGKIVIRIEFSGCTFFAKEGKEFVKQPGCEVPTIKTNKLQGRLWLEGLKSEGGTRPLVVLEPESGSVMMEETVSKKGAEACSLAVAGYKMEGNTAVRLSPENAEAAELTLIFPPSPPENAWQSAEQIAEIKIKITGEGSPVVVEIEIKIELTSKEKFGGGTFEGPHHFTVNGKAIGRGETVEITGQDVELGQLEGRIGEGASAINAHVTCNDAFAPTGAGNVLEEKGQAKLKVESKACSIYEINAGGPASLTSCKVANFVTEASGELAEAGVIKFAGKGAEKEFGRIEIENVAGSTCSVAGTYAMKGAQLCDIPSYAFEGAASKLICTGTGSKELKLGKEPAKIYSRLAIAGTKGQKLSSS